MRRNGLERPYNAMQVATWILLPLLVAQFYICVSPVIPLAASIPLSIFFGLFAIASVYHGYMCCAIDPVDARLKRHLDSIVVEQGQSGSINQHGQDESTGVVLEGGAGSSRRSQSQDGGNSGVSGPGTGGVSGSVRGGRETSPFSRAEMSDCGASSEAADSSSRTGLVTGTSSATTANERAKKKKGGVVEMVLLGAAAVALGAGRKRKNGDLEVGDGDLDEEEEDLDDDTNTKFCWVCQTRVHEKSMHCKFCDKCVGRFDHHCQWLNTCVGAANYPYFFGTVCSLCGFLAINASCSAYVWISYFVQRYTDPNCTNCTLERMNSVFGGDGRGNSTGDVLVWIILAFFVGVLMFLGLIAQLLVFHVGLQRQRISTYEYIVRDNARRREDTRIANELSSLRNRRIIEAQREGRSTLALHVGRYCKLCDPLGADRKRLVEGGVDHRVGAHHASRVANNASPSMEANGNGRVGFALRASDSDSSEIQNQEDVDDADGGQLEEQKESEDQTHQDLLDHHVHPDRYQETENETRDGDTGTTQPPRQVPTTQEQLLDQSTRDLLAPSTQPVEQPRPMRTTPTLLGQTDGGWDARTPAAATGTGGEDHASDSNVQGGVAIEASAPSDEEEDREGEKVGRRPLHDHDNGEDGGIEFIPTETSGMIGKMMVGTDLDPSSRDVLAKYKAGLGGLSDGGDGVAGGATGGGLLRSVHSDPSSTASGMEVIEVVRSRSIVSGDITSIGVGADVSVAGVELSKQSQQQHTHKQTQPATLQLI